MIVYLLVLILLVLVAGPIGLALGLSFGAVIVAIALLTGVLGLIFRGLRSASSAMAGPPPPPPGAPIGDHVERASDGWWAVVAGNRFGPWSDRLIAENVMLVERRRGGSG